MNLHGYLAREGFNMVQKKDLVAISYFYIAIFMPFSSNQLAIETKQLSAGLNSQNMPEVFDKYLSKTVVTFKQSLLL